LFSLPHKQVLVGFRSTVDSIDCAKKDLLWGVVWIRNNPLDFVVLQTLNALCVFPSNLLSFIFTALPVSGMITLPRSPYVQQLLILNTLFLWLHPTDLDKQGLWEHVLLETFCLPLVAPLNTVCERSSCSEEFQESPHPRTTTHPHCAHRATQILHRTYNRQF
jgi:hypothetical protein